MNTGIEQMQSGVDRLVQASIDRLAPVRRVREEMTSLRARLEQLETSLADLEHEPVRLETAAVVEPVGREEK